MPQDDKEGEAKVVVDKIIYSYVPIACWTEHTSYTTPHKTQIMIDNNNQLLLVDGMHKSPLNVEVGCEE